MLNAWFLIAINNYKLTYSLVLVTVYFNYQKILIAKLNVNKCKTVSYSIKNKIETEYYLMMVI